MDRLVPALLERADGPIKLTLTADDVPSAVRALPNMARVALDIRRFIDLTSLESHLVTEHHLRS